MHKQCYDALTNGMQRHQQENMTMGNKFDVVENSSFGWVPFGAIYHWCQQQHMQNPETQDKLTEY
eukprot:10656516-Heterocapsa_arctica.AAC.1